MAQGWTADVLVDGINGAEHINSIANFADTTKHAGQAQLFDLLVAIPEWGMGVKIDEAHG